MKNKLNVAAAVFISICSGVEVAKECYFMTIIDGLLIFGNLYAAGFFED